MSSVSALAADCQLAIDPDGIEYFSGSIASVNSVVYFWLYCSSAFSPLRMSWSGLLLFVSSRTSTVQGMAGELDRKQQLAFLSIFTLPDIGVADAFPLSPGTYF